jgi:hypothetical protein
LGAPFAVLAAALALLIAKLALDWATIARLVADAIALDALEALEAAEKLASDNATEAEL